MKVEPRHMVHIGDNLWSNVWGAKNTGFKAIHLSTDGGCNPVAESDPTSLVSISRKKRVSDEIVPDYIITSLSLAIKALQKLKV